MYRLYACECARTRSCICAYVSLCVVTLAIIFHASRWQNQTVEIRQLIIFHASRWENQTSIKATKGVQQSQVGIPPNFETATFKSLSCTNVGIQVHCQQFVLHLIHLDFHVCREPRRHADCELVTTTLPRELDCSKAWLVHQKGHVGRRKLCVVCCVVRSYD